jgi:molecular chaperone HtpG
MSKTNKNNKQTLTFQAEVKQLLKLMIHSLYSNKEIFIRELISNASDAIDKLKFMQLNDTNLASAEELAIEINFDKDKKIITITDNGVGMTYDEVIDNIGTIAKSGTKSFLEQLSGDKKKDSTLIGQFGVGFYSAFIVADKVEIETLKAGLDAKQAVSWKSDGSGEFTIENINKKTNGTTVILHLKDGNDEFLSDWQLRSLIKKYSDHINYPIKMIKMSEYDKDGKEIVSTELEVVNKANALWTRNKNDITSDEYKEFYKHTAHDFNDPLTWIHSRVEGTQEYTQLLYIPSKAPFDLYDNKRRYGIKLYIKRVFIMDDAEKLLPNYLRFVRGIIDSQDLPLNVSREILQSSKDIDAIRSGSTKKILNLLTDLATNDKNNYANFYKEFGTVLKEGVIEDFANKDSIAQLLRFTTTHTDADTTIGLGDYIGRMQPNQDSIYYITAESFSTAKNSPHLEIFKQKNIEVLLLTDRVDEWVVSHLSEFDKRKLVSVSSAQLNLDNKEDTKQQEEKTTQAKPILDKIKEILGDKVKEVKVSNKLVNSPSCLVVDQQSMSIHMEKILKQAGQNVPSSKPILEVNLNHILLQKIESNLASEQLKDLVLVVFDQAVLAEGLQLDDPVGFVARMNNLIN